MLISRYPVIIFSAPRTGSTALGQYIKNICDPGTLYFLEPDYRGQQEVKNFLKIMQATKKFVVKIHLLQVEKYQPYTDYLLHDPSPFRIRIRRRDFIKQAVSLYIVKTKNYLRKQEIWNANIVEPTYTVLRNETEPLVINEKFLIETIKTLEQYTNEIDNSKIKFDLDLYYEDILPLINNTEWAEYPKPANYQEILDTAERLYSTLDLG